MMARGWMPCIAASILFQKAKEATSRVASHKSSFPNKPTLALWNHDRLPDLQVLGCESRVGRNDTCVLVAIAVAALGDAVERVTLLDGVTATSSGNRCSAGRSGG